MESKSKQKIHLKDVQTQCNTDYYLEVKSEAKAFKESGMKTQFEKELKSNCKK